MERKTLMWSGIIGILLMIVPMGIAYWTGIEEVAVLSAIGVLICIGVLDALLGTKRFLKVFGVILGLILVTGLLYFGTYRVNFGLALLNDPFIAHYAKIGLIYLHIGYLLLIAIAVVVTTLVTRSFVERKILGIMRIDKNVGCR